VALAVVLTAALLLWGCGKAAKRPVVKPPPSPPSPAAPQEATLTRVLTDFYGAPYRSGGVTPAGVDCSGLVMGAFQRLGLGVPRTVAQQYTAGRPVPRNQLRFGDVVFFNRYCQVWKAGPYMASMLPSGQIAQVCHNGIYLGGGRFIHASPRGVEFGSLDDEVWRAAFIGARRFIPGGAP
jgi:cell wall-associated NlpC family hydrolase